MSVGIDFTTTGLIYAAKVHASVPTSQSLFGNAEFLEVLNHDLVSMVVPLIKSVNEEYFVTYTDVALVAGTSNYTIPTRALGGALRDIVLVDAQGRELEVPRLEPEMIKYSGSLSAPSVFGIYLKGDQAIFYPALTNAPASVYVRFKYERRPNNLCLLASAMQISVIDNTLHKITVITSAGGTTVPAGWTSAAKTTLDAILHVPAFSSVGDDMLITNIASNVLTISAATWSTNLSVGNWVSESCTSPIAQIPYEAHGLLELHAAVALLKAMKDKTGADSLNEDIKRSEEMFLKVITPRIEGAPKKVINRNGIFDSQRRWAGYVSSRP